MFRLPVPPIAKQKIWQEVGTQERETKWMVILTTALQGEQLDVRTLEDRLIKVKQFGHNINICLGPFY